MRPGGARVGRVAPPGRASESSGARVAQRAERVCGCVLEACGSEGEGVRRPRPTITKPNGARQCAARAHPHKCYNSRRRPRGVASWPPPHRLKARVGPGDDPRPLVEPAASGLGESAVCAAQLRRHGATAAIILLTPLSSTRPFWTALPRPRRPAPVRAPARQTTGASATRRPATETRREAGTGEPRVRRRTARPRPRSPRSARAAPCRSARCDARRIGHARAAATLAA